MAKAPFALNGIGWPVVRFACGGVLKTCERFFQFPLFVSPRHFVWISWCCPVEMLMEHSHMRSGSKFIVYFFVVLLYGKVVISMRLHKLFH